MVSSMLQGKMKKDTNAQQRAEKKFQCEAAFLKKAVATCVIDKCKHFTFRPWFGPCAWRAALFRRLMLLPFFRNRHEDLLAEHGEDFCGETTHKVSCARAPTPRYCWSNVSFSPIWSPVVPLSRVQSLVPTVPTPSNGFFITNCNKCFFSPSRANTGVRTEETQKSHSPSIFWTTWGFFHL